ncbi:MAG TPA: putative Ig domain-containing protein [Candidatus Aquilonibacter sp.]|nr:putative Ig domain-containing protein [Candidatus Aquilonibacter sp.]
MNRRAGLYLGYLLLFAICIYGGGCNGCEGAPSNYYQVSLTTATPIILQGGTAAITATVAHDPNNGGVSWTLSGVGTLTGATKTSVTYSAPATVATPTVVMVKASSVDFPSSVTSTSITVEPTPSITTTSLPGGNYGSPYSATINSTGGVPPFTWSITAGALTPGLALGSSNASSVAISGTPTAQTNSSFTIKITDSLGDSASQSLSIAIGAPLPLAVSTTTLPDGSLNVAYPNTVLAATGGVPPFSWSLFSGTFPPGLTLGAAGTISGIPTQTGTFSFTVQVGDSETPVVTATKLLSITVNNLGVLSGNYAFDFNGFNSSGDAVAVAGSFTADGKGNLTNGVEDVNAIGGSPKNQAFTGSYTVSNNNQGLLTFSSLTGTPAYSFSINAAGTHGRLIEFDASGTRGSGDLELRSLSTCTATTFSGYYAFGLTGEQMAVTGISSAGPDVMVGSFAATGAISPSTQGSFGPGELDANTPVRVTTEDQTVAGTYAPTTQSTRCSMTLSSTVQSNMNFSVYPVSASESFLIETDTVNSTTPMLTAGTMQQQTGAPFLAAPGSTFTGTSVAALTGSYPSGNAYVPDVGLMVISGTGTSSFTLNAAENLGGSLPVYQALGANFIQADTYGRVATNIVTPPFAPVFYMIDQNTAYCIGELTAASSQPNPFFGIVQPQSTGPFTASSISGTFVEGTAAPAESPVQDVAGTVTLANTTSTTGTVAGTQDQSTSQAKTPGETVSGAYSIVNSTFGTGTLSLTSPDMATGLFVTVSPTEVLMITTTTNDTNPAIFIFEQ